MNYFLQINIRKDDELKNKIIVLAILSTILVVGSALLLSGDFMRQRQAQRDVARILQEDENVQRLIEHVEKVMRGEIVYERETNPLWIYFRSDDRRLDILDRVDVDLNIVSITLDEDRGEIRASYSIRWFDSSGRKLYAVGVHPERPAIWTLERQGDDWVIVEVYEPL